MELGGRIKVIFDTQTFDSGFKKREFVVTTQEQYPQDIKFELYNDKVDVLTPFSVGDEVNVAFNLRGKEYQGRYFVNVNAWKVDKMGATGGDVPPMPGMDAIPPAAPMPTSSSSDTSASSEEDDLPF